jgi:hypothetical protein
MKYNQRILLIIYLIVSTIYMYLIGKYTSWLLYYSTCYLQDTCALDTCVHIKNIVTNYELYISFCLYRQKISLGLAVTQVLTAKFITA